MSTVNLRSGTHYHISINNNVKTVEFTDGIKLYGQNVELNSGGGKNILDYCEERIKLSDGKTLKRIRDVLTVT